MKRSLLLGILIAAIVGGCSEQRPTEKLASKSPAPPAQKKVMARYEMRTITLGEKNDTSAVWVSGQLLPCFAGQWVGSGRWILCQGETLPTAGNVEMRFNEPHTEFEIERISHHWHEARKLQ